MEELFFNDTNSREDSDCMLNPGYMVSLFLINVFTFLIGQPVIAKLLWITFTSKKSTDILHSNLALFHNFLYLICILHVIFTFVLDMHRSALLKIILIYAQTGGPMSLSFICVERYVAVVWPTSYPLLKKYKCREVCAAMVWISSLATVMTTMLTKYISHFSEMVINSIPVSVMVLMTIVMVWCSIRVASALRKYGPGGEKLPPVKRKAFRTVCATTAINLLCYIPVTVMQRFKRLDESAFQCSMAPVCVLVLSVASVVHPVFYLSTQRKLLSCFKRQKK